MEENPYQPPKVLQDVTGNPGLMRQKKPKKVNKFFWLVAFLVPTLLYISLLGLAYFFLD